MVVMVLKLEYLLIYLAVMTVAGFASMGLDKRRAVRRAWRVPEKTLFFIAALGGSVGSLLGMAAFRHKTKHLRFVIGMPLILVLQAVLVIYILNIMG